MEKKEKTVRQVLAKLDSVLVPVGKNQAIAEELMARLKISFENNSPGDLLEGSEFYGASRGDLGSYGASSLIGEDVFSEPSPASSDKSLLSGSTFFHSGSAFEGLAVSRDTDFDISLQLKKPFVSDRFKIEEREGKFVVLTLRNNAPEHPRLAKYITDGRFRAQDLHKDVMSELEAIMKRVVVPYRTIYCEQKLCALYVQLSCEGEEDVEMDIVPHIPVSSLVWKDLPQLVELGKLPVCLQKEIQKMEENGNRFVFFTPIVPNSEKYDCGEELGSLAFGKLEKTFFRSKVKIRNMVRLVKLVAHRNGWSEFGLRPFHIKRLAIKISDQLDKFDEWDGYKFLLKSIREELRKNSFIEDIFIKEARFGIKAENLCPLLQRLDQALLFTTTDLYNMI